MTRTLTPLVLGLLLLLLGPIPAHAAPGAPTSSTQQVTLKINTSRVLRFPDKITRIYIINQRIADVSQVRARSFTLTARALGQSRLEVAFRRHKVILRITVVR